MADIDSDFTFETTLISPQSAAIGQWSWGFRIINDDIIALDVLLLSGGTSEVSVDQGFGIISASDTSNGIVENQNYKNVISIALRDNIVTLKVNGTVVQTVATNGTFTGEASIYRDVLGYVTLPGFRMTSENATLIHTRIVQAVTINMGPIVGSEIVSRVDIDYFDSLNVTFSYPLKLSERIMDMGLRIGFEDIELILVETIKKFTGNSFFIFSESLFPSIQVVEQHALRRVTDDHSGDHFDVSLVNLQDGFLFTVDGQAISLSRYSRWGEVSYIEFFVNSDRQHVEDNSAYFKNNPYVDLTDLNIWSR